MNKTVRYSSQIYLKCCFPLQDPIKPVMDDWKYFYIKFMPKHVIPQDHKNYKIVCEIPTLNIPKKMFLNFVKKFWIFNRHTTLNIFCSKNKIFLDIKSYNTEVLFLTYIGNQYNKPASFTYTLSEFYCPNRISKILLQCEIFIKNFFTSTQPVVEFKVL